MSEEEHEEAIRGGHVSAGQQVTHSHTNTSKKACQVVGNSLEINGNIMEIKGNIIISVWYLYFLCSELIRYEWN